MTIDWNRKKLRLLAIASLATAALGGNLLLAQPPNNAAGDPNANAANALIVPGGGQNAVLFGPGGAAGPQGGAANADFDSLIDLITSTVSTETWAENGGGEAEIRPFFGGVLVDAAGTMQLHSPPRGKSDLAAKRGAAPTLLPALPNDARQESALRYVSMPRLEREIARRQADHEPLEESMLTLAGLQRVQYVFIYPETGDIVLAGPAGDWAVGGGRILSVETGQPVVRLDDLLVLLRRGDRSASSFFGCSINPRQDALADAQTFLHASSTKPLQPGRRDEWLAELRDTVGLQEIDIFGIDPASRAARAMVEADYHMKLIGMGLADGVEGVESYLDLLKQATTRAGASPPPPISVLRWWFTLDYDAIAATEAGDAFELQGQGVRVLSENEMLAAQGRRVHTGRSDSLNKQFADDFTAHFAELSEKYPIYGELRNLFDLAIAVAVIHSENLMERAGWQLGMLIDGERLQLPQSVVPRHVETVINHRVLNSRQFVAGVSGGVVVSPGDVLREVRMSDTEIPKPIGGATQEGAWWWDAE